VSDLSRPFYNLHRLRTAAHPENHYITTLKYLRTLTPGQQPSSQLSGQLGRTLIRSLTDCRKVIIARVRGRAWKCDSFFEVPKKTEEEVGNCSAVSIRPAQGMTFTSPY